MRQLLELSLRSGRTSINKDMDCFLMLWEGGQSVSQSVGRSGDRQTDGRTDGPPCHAILFFYALWLEPRPPSLEPKWLRFSC
eukprot:3531338-Karenia_brevis.AAC.1